jgi:poly [ADP-ribose] polymerase
LNKSAHDSANLQELELVDALGDMEIAQKLISASILRDDAGNPLNHMDSHFKSLGLTSMEPVVRDTGEFKALDKYVQDTHGATHKHYRTKVQHVFRVERYVFWCSMPCL